MLQNWIRPIEPDAFTENIPSHKAVFGRHLHVLNATDWDLTEVRICLVGMGDADADAVRKELYAMSFPFEGLGVADLGNMRRLEPNFMVTPLRELMDSKIFPILIGNAPEQSLAQYNALLSLEQWNNFVLVDRELSSPRQIGSAQWQDGILRRKEAKLFHFGLIGAQTHWMSLEDFHFLEARHYDVVRLGEARTDPTALEPIIRDADVMAFHLQAIRQSDAPGQPVPSASGFTVEEACQICRYAGMSDKLKSFGVFGCRTALDVGGQTAQVVAQMIWYCIEGFYQRKGDFPASTDGLIQYMVEWKHAEQPLVFWKSSKSGRWWLQLAVKTGRKPVRHRLVPCTYADYQMACRNELPDRLLHALGRFG